MGQMEQRVFWTGGTFVLLAYSVTLAVAQNMSLGEAIPAGVANTVPTLIFGVAAYWIITRFVAARTPVEQVAAHIIIATMFVFLAYWLLVVMLGLLHGTSVTQFEVRPLVSRAMAWQSLQNLTTYGVVALLAYLSRRPHDRTNVTERAPPERQALSRYFIRRGDDILPVDVEAIVSINGADDYAEVATATDRHLARMTLAGFERALDPARFARVHRSSIVNLQSITLAEPAGSGRLLLHLSNGDTMVTSRAGAAVLRERVL